ncbi:hypothetical protein CYMTET_37834 [Cymbomonas tetramitiformis]|uniref:Uncharacterized protein n=1 Tax=Cymbomonas tetramitiformis TaxID=36881 RepID=A0AAE0CEG5_9CHLO|nr:hypothetical protein CYMTET_37834 [Cymbomonas tetramitiformis]
MSTEGSGPESIPSTPVSPVAAVLAAAAAASEPAANQFLFAFDDVDEMDHYDKDSHTLDKDDVKLHCTGATWAVCKVFEEGDADGEQSDEWESEGTSTKGLTGTDGTEDSHYFWSLRAFIAELEAKFLMKGTKEKEDLLIAKSQTTEQDGLAYVKSCRRREAALNAGKMVEDPIVRQDIEECIKGLRIKEYRDRMSEQLRVSHPAPNKVTWEDLEVIVEVQDKLKNDAESWALALQQELVRRLTCVYSCYEARQLGLDLAALVSAMRRSGSAPKTGDRRRDPRKKKSTQHGGDDPKKPSREVNNAERQKPTYGRVPPPDAPKEFQCDWCFTRLPHPPERCYTGCRDARVPPNFHKDRQSSRWPNEVKNAQMRAYNIAHRFENSKMGITTKEWLKLPEAKQKQPQQQQQQQVAASAEPLPG